MDKPSDVREVLQRDDIRTMANRAIAKGAKHRQQAAIGLLDGVLQESVLDENTRFLLDVVRTLVSYDED